MAIIIDQTEKLFTIQTKNSTYQMKADSYGFLLHLYYGRHMEGSAEYLLAYYDRGFSGNPYDVGMDRTYSMDVLPQEFPSRGSGDYRKPAIDIINADGTYGCDPRYQDYKIGKGKYDLPGLPAVYADENEAETLVITLRDETSGIQVELFYGVLPELDIITRSARITNIGREGIRLERIQSACLDFVGGKFDLLTFYGRHMMERNVQREEVLHGVRQIGSRRGASSHQYNPMMILADRETTEDSGKCYGMSFVYSGNFLGEVELDQFNLTRMQLGIGSDQFSYPLKSGQSFYAPEVVMTYSSEGMGQLSRNFHKCIRRHICRGKYRDVIRPILVNSWEAAYMDFDGNTIRNLAKEAANLGVDMVVMDDGWFGKRNDDNSGLGDWQVNEEKLGCSLGELVRDVNDMGVKFGIWVEPEMISEDSDLFREHPDWVLSIPGKKPVRARNQLVLDFSSEEVVNTVYQKICHVLDQGNIEYLKWDMNRSIADVYSCSGKAQGTVLYDYMLGLYNFLDKLCERYPNLLIEGCSGGGGRFDMGMMYYTPQIWCSDNTDAIDRLKIQYGTSFGYPLSVVGSHVSDVPNHQTGRGISMKTRGVVAMAGTFGYEMDFAKLSEEDREEIRQQIEDYHKYAPLVYFGDYYRLSSPVSDEAAAWEIVSEDKSEVLFNVVIQEIHGNMTVPYIRLKGLDSGRMYKDQKSGRIYSADALMEIGMPVSVQCCPCQAEQMYFVRV